MKKMVTEVRSVWNDRFENLDKILAQRYSEMSSIDQNLKDSIFSSYYRYYNDGDKNGFKTTELKKIGCSDATIKAVNRSATTNIRRQTKPYRSANRNRGMIYPTGYKPDIDAYEAAMEDVIKCAIKYFVKKYPQFFNKAGRQKSIYDWKEEIINYTKRSTGELDTYWIAEFANQFNVGELKKYNDIKKSGQHTITDKAEIVKVLRIMLNSALNSFEKIGESKILKLTTNQKQLVKEYIKKIQTKKLNEDMTSIRAVIEDLRYLEPDEMIFLLHNIATFYRINQEELSNMQAMQISKHLTSAANLIAKRTGN